MSAAARAESVGQRLTTADPDRLVTAWEVEGVTVVAWDLDGHLYAIGLPVPYGMATAARVSARDFVAALNAHLSGEAPAVVFEEFEAIDEPPLGGGELLPVGGFGGVALFDLLLQWWAVVWDQEQALVLTPAEEIDAPAVVLAPDEARRLIELFPFGDDEWVLLAVDEGGRPIMIGGLCMVRFSTVELDGGVMALS